MAYGLLICGFNDENSDDADMWQGSPKPSNDSAPDLYLRSAQSCGYTAILGPGIEPAISVPQRSNTIGALHRVGTVMGFVGGRGGSPLSSVLRPTLVRTVPSLKRAARRSRAGVKRPRSEPHHSLAPSAEVIDLSFNSNPTYDVHAFTT
jgi:hypothetical protein